MEQEVIEIWYAKLPDGNTVYFDLIKTSRNLYHYNVRYADATKGDVKTIGSLGRDIMREFAKKHAGDSNIEKNWKLQRQWWSGDEWAPGKLLTPFQAPSPVFQTEYGWFFCDETWTACYGPYDTREECNEACCKYAKQI